jgi:hypothetical protein
MCCNEPCAADDEAIRTFYAIFRSHLPELIDRHRADIFDELEPTTSSAFGVPIQL